MRIVKGIVPVLACAMIILSCFPVTSQAQTPPHLEVDKSVNPTEIWQKGSGIEPEEATVTLTVTGAGDPVVEKFPVDVILVIDRSNSTREELPEIRDAAKTFIGCLDDTTDRSGLVSYSTSARLDQSLTSDLTAMNDSIDDLSSSKGRSAMGKGIYKANEELMENGRSEAMLVEVLLSDGQQNWGQDPIKEAEDAAEKNITIYTIGLGEMVNECRMEQIADITGGKYHYAPDTTDLEDIYREIGEYIHIQNIAGDEIVVTDVLQDHINEENGFTIEPDIITENPDGTTTIVWNIGRLTIGETWEVSFNVSSDEIGDDLPVNVYDDSGVTYKDYKGDITTENFPEVKVTVRPSEIPSVPIIEVDKSANPTEIWKKDSGMEPEETTVTLTVTGAGDPYVERYPLDAMLIMDRSESMDWDGNATYGSRLADAKAAAKEFIGLLNSEYDRVGLVSFSGDGGDYGSVTLDEALTDDFSVVSDSIDGLIAYGATDIGDAIDLAIKVETEEDDTSEAVRIGILLTDGSANRPNGRGYGEDPMDVQYAIDKAKEADGEDITIYTIGLGSEINETMLQEIADITGGKYYYTLDSTDLEDIFKEIAECTLNIAGDDIVVTDVLQDYINGEDRFTISPDMVIANPDGTTEIIWNIGRLTIGETWNVSFNVSSNKIGDLPVNVYEDSGITYKNYKGDITTESFPELNILVKIRLD
jgi:Mg-chelatase subunit ChlD